MDRPPSSNAYILYQNMVRVWQSMFLPASGCALLGLLCLAYAALLPLVGVTVGWYWKFRPRLGTQD